MISLEKRSDLSARTGKGELKAILLGTAIALISYQEEQAVLSMTKTARYLEYLTLHQNLLFGHRSDAVPVTIQHQEKITGMQLSQHSFGTNIN